jgi:hypothetical protein
VSPAPATRSVTLAVVKPKKRDRIKKLERENLELKAQLAYVYHYAKLGIGKCDREQIKGSGIVVQMHWLGGKEVCPAFCLKDGLSQDTIRALNDDLKFSYDQAVEFGVR